MRSLSSQQIISNNLLWKNCKNLEAPLHLVWSVFLLVNPFDELNTEYQQTKFFKEKFGRVVSELYIGKWLILKTLGTSKYPTWYFIQVSTMWLKMTISRIFRDVSVCTTFEKSGKTVEQCRSLPRSELMSFLLRLN